MSSNLRMNVLLDLDNTLINSLEQHERENIPLEYQNKFHYEDMIAYGMRVFARPGLQEFLDYLFDNFNVSIFTAAEQEYALFIVNHFILIKPNRKIHYLLFRHHVDIGITRYGETKDLRLLWNVMKLPGFQPCNTVIVDDLDEVQQANPLNTIRVKSFDVSKNDQFLYSSLNDHDLKRVEHILKKVNQKFKASRCIKDLYLNQDSPVSSPFLL